MSPIELPQGRLVPLSDTIDQLAIRESAELRHRECDRPYVLVWGCDSIAQGRKPNRYGHAIGSQWELRYRSCRAVDLTLCRIPCHYPTRTSLNRQSCSRRQPAAPGSSSALAWFFSCAGVR